MKYFWVNWIGNVWKKEKKRDFESVHINKKKVQCSPLKVNTLNMNNRLK